jgi:hypothetical protein
MKRISMISLLIGISVTHAQADQFVYTYYDTIRPHGHKRPDAVGEANIRLCDERAGIHQDATPAYKKCMRELGYRYVSRRLVRTPELLQDSPDDSSSDSSPPTDTFPEPSRGDTTGLPPDATVTIPTFDQNTGAPLPP